MWAVGGFDWDEANRGKCRKHGLSIAEIEALLRGSPDVYPDAAHSVAEQRRLAIGRTAAGRAAIVAFTIREVRGRRLVRPISARYMHAKEIQRYEQAQAEAAPRSDHR